METLGWGRRSALALLALSIGACGVETTRFPLKQNPRRWAFERPLAEVVRCLKNDDGLIVDAWNNRARKALGTEPVEVRDKSYEMELRSEGYGSDAAHSESYLRRSCPLGLYGHWRIRAYALTPERTEVDVVPLELSVHNYDCFYIGHPWGCAIEVESTSVEEYRMLLSLGACLGVAMPHVYRPCGATADPNTCD